MWEFLIWTFNDNHWWFWIVDKRLELSPSNYKRHFLMVQVVVYLCIVHYRLSLHGLVWICEYYWSYILKKFLPFLCFLTTLMTENFCYFRFFRIAIRKFWKTSAEIYIVEIMSITSFCRSVLYRPICNLTRVSSNGVEW